MAEAVKATYVQRGDNIDYTPTKKIAYMEVVPLAARIGVALSEIPKGEMGSVTLVGAFRLPATTGEIEIGAEVYWDKSDNAIVAAASTDTVRAGYAIAPKEQADTVALVRIG